MLTTISLVAAAVLATATGTTQPLTVTTPSTPIAHVVDTVPAWRTVHADTVSDLIITTETSAGRVRFTARGTKSAVPVTTADFPADSVTSWLTAADQLAATASPKMGEVRSLGSSLALTITQTVKGESALGFYVADAMSDQTVALALTKPQLSKLTTALRAALAAART